MIHSPRTTPRSEFQQQENLRVQQSPSLKGRFPALKSVTLDLGHYDPEGVTRNSQIKYTVNVEHAKSVFRVGCHNPDCVRGDFDLSAVLAAAVAQKRTTVTGEMRCPGWRNRATIDSLPCGNLLRYKLTLSF